MDENAVPISTERASPRRAPDTVSTTAAAAARPAVMPSAKKWTPPGISTSLWPKKWIAAPGTTAQAASSPRREAVRCRTRRPIPTRIGRHLAGLEATCARGDRLRERGPARGNRRPRGAARASAHARERGVHPGPAARGGRPRQAGAPPSGARPGRRGKALHPGGGGRGDGAQRRLPERGSACARRAGAGSRRARGHRGGARAVAQRQDAAGRGPVRGGVPRAHLRHEPLDGERRGLAGLHLRRGADPAGRHRARPRPSIRRDATQPRPARGAHPPADAQPAAARADAEHRHLAGGAAERSSSPVRSPSPSASSTSSASRSSARTSRPRTWGT